MAEENNGDNGRMSSSLSRFTPPRNQLEALTQLLLQSDPYGGLVKLKGIEEEEEAVPIHKFYLRAWSPVSRAMFDGGFREVLDGSEIKTEFPTHIIQWMVEFCSTGELSLLDSSVPVTTTDLARDLILLSDAADYFDIEELSVQITNKFFPKRQIEDSHPVTPSLVAFVLDNDNREGTALSEAAMGMIRMNPLRALIRSTPEHRTFRLLSHRSMVMILGDPSIHCIELFLFKLLLCWAKYSESNLALAKEMAERLLFLARTTPAELYDIVRGIRGFRLIISRTAWTNASAQQDLLCREYRGWDRLKEVAHVKRSELFGGLFVTVKGAGLSTVDGRYFVVSKEMFRQTILDQRQNYVNSCQNIVFLQEGARVGQEVYHLMEFQNEQWILKAIKTTYNGIIETVMYTAKGKKNIVPTEGWQTTSTDDFGEAPMVQASDDN